MTNLLMNILNFFFRFQKFCHLIIKQFIYYVTYLILRNLNLFQLVKFFDSYFKDHFLATFFPLIILIFNPKILHFLSINFLIKFHIYLLNLFSLKETNFNIILLFLNYFIELQSFFLSLSKLINQQFYLSHFLKFRYYLSKFHFHYFFHKYSYLTIQFIIKNYNIDFTKSKVFKTNIFLNFHH